MCTLAQNTAWLAAEIAGKSSAGAGEHSVACQSVCLHALASDHECKQGCQASCCMERCCLAKAELDVLFTDVETAINTSAVSKSPAQMHTYRAFPSPTNSGHSEATLAVAAHVDGCCYCLNAWALTQTWSQAICWLDSQSLL